MASHLVHRTSASLPAFIHNAFIAAAILATISSPALIAGNDPYKEDILASIKTAKAWAAHAFSAPNAGVGKSEGLYIEKNRNVVRLNRTVWDAPLQLGEKKYEHGVYMDTPAAVRVVLDHPVREFTARIGIDNNSNTQSAPQVGSARFHVRANGRDVFVSPVLKLSDSPVPLKIPLDGAKEFVLEVDDGGDGIGFDQCDWADALVTLTDGQTVYLDALGFHAATSNRKLAVPFSFLYDGQPSDLLLGQWIFTSREEKVDGGSVRLNEYKDPKTGLVIQCEIRTWNDCAIADWVYRLTNTGDADTGLIENFLPMDSDSLFGSPVLEPMTLRWLNGDKTSFDSFLPHDEALEPGKPRDFHSPLSSNLVFPYFNLQGRDGGWILAVGWTGRWKAEFQRDAGGGVVVKAGMEKTRFRLKPGEQVRTPSMVLLRWTGSEIIDGHNQFRRAVLSHYVQELNGKPAEPPIAHNTCGSLYEIAQDQGKPLGRLNEAGELKTIEKIAGLGCDTYWMDAYWYPQPWNDNLGNWYPRPEDFPNGLRPLADAAHKEGMKFVLWMLPPSVSRGTQFARQYPQYLHGGGNGAGGLWKMGDPEAREFLTRFVCDCMNKWQVDIYREDGSGLPPEEGPADRIGIAEMKHIAGLYRFWSDITAKSHATSMDNCCGGGNRIDIETSRRSFYLWRSDFDDILEGLKGRKYWPRMGRNDQVMIGGLNLYVPFHTGPVWDVTPYNFRSDMTAGIVLYGNVAREGFRDDFARKGIAELKELRPLFQGDYYPLMKLTVDQADWFAYQLDRPDLGQGCAFFFRRVESDILAYQAHLHNIDPEAVYEASYAGETYDMSPWKKMTGRELMSQDISIKEKPGSALLRYRLAPASDR
ncbi:MAG: NPCBM/NEW2 domain-containing protein [Candidatus Omnitrophica bacterium]|nr:NPCBM/NEW2 domain-containing protein [Candidatus Omnitrophota bacterium]